MGDLSVDQWVNVAASMLAAAVCGAFVVLFHLRARWWRTDLGRNQMGLPAAIGALCLYTILVSLWPDGCFAIVLRGVRTAIVLTITVLMAQRIRMMLQAQREHHDHP
ncbi:putative phage holin [Streptomyces tauricus]|uniref:putative phage holin n=1 Tax=Streptomyces tauricus TaxID=68274 RepID=UPI00342C988F